MVAGMVRDYLRVPSGSSAYLAEGAQRNRGCDRSDGQQSETQLCAMETNLNLTASLGDRDHSRSVGVWLLYGCQPVADIFQIDPAIRHQKEWRPLVTAVLRKVRNGGDGIIFRRLFDDPRNIYNHRHAEGVHNSR